MVVFSSVFYVVVTIVGIVGVWLYHNVSKASGGKGVPVVGAFLDQYTLVLNFVDQDQKKSEVVNPNATDTKKSDSKTKRKRSRHKKIRDHESKSRSGKPHKKKHSHRSRHNKKSKRLEVGESASSNSVESKTEDKIKRGSEAGIAVQKK